MRKLNRELYWLQGLGGLINAYVWNGNTLLDTGGPLVAHALFHEATRAGFDKRSFQNVLLSHCHLDHAGGLFHIRHQVQVYGFESDLQVLKGHSAPPKYHPKYGVLVETAERLVPAFRFGKHHQSTAVGDGGLAQGWQAVHIPGHTSGSVCWYQPETRTLFTGDVLVNHFNFLTGPAALFTEDYPLALRSLQRLKELEIETVIFGHGIPLVKNSEKRLHALLDRLAEKLKRESPPVVPRMGTQRIE